MNIGMMQLSNVQPATKQITSPKSTSNETSQTSKFGQVFNSVVSSTNKTEQTSTTSVDAMNDETLAILNANSVEELLDVLGIPHEQGLLLLQVGEEGQAFAMDELMDLNTLLDLLNMDVEELNELVGKLLGEDVEIFNIWQFVELMNEQAPKIFGELNAVLQGEGNISQKDAKSLIEFLKLTELAGKQSDLVSDQPVQLSQLKEMLTQLSTQTTKSTQTQTSTNAQGLQVVTKTETTETQQVGVNTAQQTTTKTITVTLPNTNQTAQSEALAKEIQNLLNRSQISTTQGTTKLLLKLYPENLGSIRIEIMQKDGVLTARLLASTAIGKELLDSQLHQLRNAFAQANIQMERIDVAQSLQEADLKRDQNLFSNLFNQQQHNEEEQTEEEQDDEEKLSFEDILKMEEV